MGGDAVRVAGLGFRAGAEVASLADALARAEAMCGAPADALAVPLAKAGAAALRDLAVARALHLRAVDVAGIVTPMQSPRVRALFQTGSVAEAAALAGAGPGAHLSVLRVISADGMATAAIAMGYLDKQEEQGKVTA